MPVTPALWRLTQKDPAFTVTPSHPYSLNKRILSSELSLPLEPVLGHMVTEGLGTLWRKDMSMVYTLVTQPHLSDGKETSKMAKTFQFKDGAPVPPGPSSSSESTLIQPESEVQ